jgi:hypothetical protein
VLAAALGPWVCFGLSTGGMAYISHQPELLVPDFDGLRRYFSTALEMLSDSHNVDTNGMLKKF